VEIALDATSRVVAGGDDSGAGGGELGPARLERAGHRVEGSFQRPDLTNPGLGHPHGEIAAGQAAGHRGGPADRQDDRPRQVGADQEDEQYRSDQADHHRCDGPARRSLGPILSARRQIALG
jgi:hypothetical protein